jgi:6-pyruvoyltetrahydropterin/6-carboxytetrahydropterin synthase
VNLYDLKEILKQVLGEFDHKHLNLDTPYFTSRVPTTENIAGVLWQALQRRPEIGRLEQVRLFEDEDLYAEVDARGFEGSELRRATLIRRYPFSAPHRGLSGGACREAGEHGHDYMIDVAVAGPIDPATGMVTDLTALDRAVRAVLRDVAGRAVPCRTGEQLAHELWTRLQPAVAPARPVRLRLAETRDTFYEITDGGPVSGAGGR